MLYDNAQLARTYLHGYAITGETNFRRVCEETLDFLLREMTHPRGRFYSTLHANSEGEEGKFCVWTSEETEAALGSGLEFFKAAHGIPPQGNWKAKQSSKYRLHMVLATSTYPPPSNAPALLRDRPLKDGNPAVYVCEGFVCNNPLATITELENLL